MSEGEIKTRMERFYNTFCAKYGDEDNASYVSAKTIEAMRKVVDSAKKDLFNAVGNFEFTQPYDYNLPQLRIRYEEAATKLMLTYSKLMKWFGSDESP
jgi:hypothetical protein